jgi:hypothetical protein
MVMLVRLCTALVATLVFATKTRASTLMLPEVTVSNTSLDGTSNCVPSDTWKEALSKDSTVACMTNTIFTSAGSSGESGKHVNDPPWSQV